MQSQTLFSAKKQFLLAHPTMILHWASAFYPFTHAQLKKYKAILIWDYASNNIAIDWTEPMFDEFHNLLFDFEKKSFTEVHLNTALPWSVTFIQKYFHLWNWESLTQNEAILSNAEIREHFKEEFLPYLNSAKEIYNKQELAKSFGEKEIEKLEGSEYSFMNIKEWQIAYPEEIENTKNLNWVSLSQNELLPWSPELIKKYENNWSWHSLLFNNSIKWDFNLLKLYESKFDWIVDKIFTQAEMESEEVDTTINAMFGVSGNLDIKWDKEMISHFKHKLDFPHLSYNQSIEWDLDILQEFSADWDYVALAMNEHVWTIAFPEFKENEKVICILDELLKSN